MHADKIRKEFLDYFKKHRHTVVPSSGLVPADDPSVLLTSAGMQQFKKFFSGSKDPEKELGNRRVTSAQRCFRTTDIESVGDETHLTFFEMLGNFSFGDYFKKESIEMAFEFLVKKLHLRKDRIRATFFSGDANAPEDVEAKGIFLQFIPSDAIFPGDKHTNWWGPTGSSGPCGPSAEIHYDLTGVPCNREKGCIPNCPCGRFVELWNLVFTEYQQSESGRITKLKEKNIDTGMGFERLCMIVQKKQNIFETDLFSPLLEVVRQDEGFGSTTPREDEMRLRVVADHIRGACFLLMDGIGFSNREQGYILRRVFRRAVDQYLDPRVSFDKLVTTVGKIYAHAYPEIIARKQHIVESMEREFSAYEKVLSLDVEAVILKHLKDTPDQPTVPNDSRRPMKPEDAFILYSTYGISPERLIRAGYNFSLAEFEKQVEQHKMSSRQGAQAKFGGHGLNDPEQSSLSPQERWEMTKLHTATHLLNQALRTILGPHVRQQGSDITADKLRFDFEHPSKLTDEEKNAVEQLVNKKIQEDLKVTWQRQPLEQAVREGALSFFREKYPPEVTVFSIGDFSKELCGGPHVAHTGQIGTLKLIGEKSSGSGIRRIKAEITGGETWNSDGSTPMNVIPKV